MTARTANHAALWSTALCLVLLMAMLVIGVSWWLEDTPVVPGPAYAVTEAGDTIPNTQPIIVKAGGKLMVRHSYCITGSQPGTLNQALEDGVLIVLPSQPWVRRKGCGEHTFVINLPNALERGHPYLYRASITTHVNPMRPAETVWFPPVPFIVPEG